MNTSTPKLLLTISFCCLLLNADATLYTVGNGTTQTTSTNQTPFSNAVSDARRQFIIQASELTSQGLHFSYISSLAFNVGTTFNTNVLNSFNVKIKQTNASTLTGTFDNTGLLTVFSGNVSITASGWKTFPFTNNFFWDGNSNLLIEVCYNNAGTSGTSTSVIATANLIQYCQVATGTTTAVGCNLGPSATTVNTRPNMRLDILPVNCNGAPQAGTINGPSSYSVITDPSFTLTLTGYEVAEGISKQWYSAPSASGPWSAIAGATGSSITKSITQTTYYICSVFCSFTNDSSATAVKEVQTPPDCSGALSFGTISGVDSICYGTSFTITHQIGTLYSSVSYQWQSAPVSGSFANISGATNALQVTTSITQATQFRLRAICNVTNDTSYSAVKTVSITNFLLCYCTPPGEGGGDNYLIRVRLNELDSAFYPNVYPDHAALDSPVITIYKGMSNELSYQGQAWFVYDAVVGVYIDYNHNGIFEPSAGELAGENVADSDYNMWWYIGFTVPDNALNGITRMRVRLQRGNYSTPCGDGTTFQYNVDNSVADYYVNVVNPSPVLQCKVLFQGLTSGNTMQPALYNSGMSADNTVSDSVTIELHYATSPFSKAYAASGVADRSGNVSVSFPAEAYNNTYYIVVKHRNSLETWSKNPLLFSPAVKTIDFTH